jgi:hypothetical protein
MWKANGKTTTLQLFLDSFLPKNMRNSSSGDLSLEEAMDLSRDRQILEQVLKLLFMQFFPALYYFIPLRSKYNPQHLVLKPLSDVVYSWYLAHFSTWRIRINGIQDKIIFQSMTRNVCKYDYFCKNKIVFAISEHKAQSRMNTVLLLLDTNDVANYPLNRCHKNTFQVLLRRTASCRLCLTFSLFIHKDINSLSSLLYTFLKYGPN